MKESQSKHSTQTKKPIWKKWWVWVIIVVILAAIGGNSTNNVNTDTDVNANTNTNVNPQSSSEKQQDATDTKPVKESYRDQFVKAFEEASGRKITDVTDFDPQNRDSGHYRTEYRLGAYNGSNGAHGTIGDMSIDMVEYGGYGKPENNTMFRIYLVGPKTSVVNVYPSLAKAMDPSLTDSDIQGALSEFNAGNNQLTDPLSVSPSHKRIANDTLSSIGDSAEAYIDADFSR